MRGCLSASLLFSSVRFSRNRPARTIRVTPFSCEPARNHQVVILQAMRPRPHNSPTPIHSSRLENSLQLAFIPPDLPARPAQALPSCAAAGQQRRSSRMRIAFHTRSVLGLLGICFVLLGGAQAQAAVTITNATGGTNISADTAQNATTP